jgi:glycogen phosphorylase
MDGQILLNRPCITCQRNEIDGYEQLEALALDLIWSWTHCGDPVWQQLDHELWEITHNPWIVLQTVSREKLKKKLSDPNFRKTVDHLLEVYTLKTEGPAWFQKNHPKTSLSHAAYFSMEYMLSEALPIYSGGLGNVAGDQLKAASDLGVPVIAVGLLYQQGYFRQTIDKEGAQQAFYPYNEPGQLPITPLRKSDGEWLRLEVALPGWSLWLRAWEVKVGRVRLYLLDSNDAANFPAHRGITSELYGGGSELRLKQELTLGLGGYRLLDALGIKPEVCHLNECHAAFVILERAAKFMQETGCPFDVALTTTRAGNLFTTHTAVPAGFDRFPPDLLEQYLGKYAEQKLGIDFQDLLALGRQNPKDPHEHFNMAYLAIRGSGAINGVSQLHAKVSRHIFAPLFPRWSEDEVPVGYITNGVHVPSWDSKQSDDLWTEACGKACWLDTTESLEKGIRSLPDARIWQMRNSVRRSLVDFTRERATRQLAVLGAPLQDVENAKNFFDPHALTLGFARRFATYKRPNMLLHNPERLLHILNNSDRPVQLIIAGKAHPADIPGQNLIKEWTHFIKRPEARARVVFLSDDDMLLTEQLVQGVDVWINTPRRPWEACGTSGMKVLVNGGLNLSELDGWWAEAYTPEVGWALGDGKEHGEDPSWDAVEAEILYDLLEHEIVPQFYNRDSKGIPTAWIARIRESMARLTPRFSANRSVREYTEKHYLPAAEAYRSRSSGKEALSEQLINWKHTLDQKWTAVQFRAVHVNTTDKGHEFEVQVCLSGLDPDAVQIELYANGLNDGSPERKQMLCVDECTDDGSCIYRASVPAVRPSSDYTPRIIPHYSALTVPLEANEILWQK